MSKSSVFLALALSLRKAWQSGKKTFNLADSHRHVFFNRPDRLHAMNIGNANRSQGEQGPVALQFTTLGPKNLPLSDMQHATPALAFYFNIKISLEKADRFEVIDSISLCRRRRKW